MIFSKIRWAVVFLCACSSLQLYAQGQTRIDPWPDPSEVGKGIGSKWFGEPESFEVSGELAVADNVYIDGDTNDVNTAFVPNNGNDGVQELFTPFSLVGFVTELPTGGGDDERFANTSDEIDTYSVYLTNNEPVTLRIADYEGETNDLELYLYDAGDLSNPVASSLTISQEESVRAPSDGQYVIVVSAYSGRSNYLLQSGREPLQQADSLSVSADFVLDQLILGLDFKSKLTAADYKGKPTTALDIEKRYKLERIADTADGTYLYSITDPLVIGKGAFPLTKFGFGIEDIRKWLVIEKTKSLLSLSNIAFAGPNYYAYQYKEPNDPGYQYQWHYPIIRLPQAWDITTGSKDIVVAVIDSGVAPHPDLEGNVDYGLGVDLVPLDDGSGDGDGPDFNAADPGCEFLPVNCSSHGTHVAGTVGASSDNASGVAGVNWTTTIMPIRIFGKDPDSTSSCWRIQQALRWAGRLSNTSGTVPARKADVINMSLGALSPCSGTQALINSLRAGGTIIIAAAGNEGNTVPNYPASYNGVTSVSATTPLDTLASFSSYGSNVDIAAPGGDGNGDFTNVISTGWVAPKSEALRFDYEAMPGTSMASPHVAGVAALMKSVYPEMTPSEFDSSISSGAITDDLAQNGPANKDQKYGWGRVNALKAVNWAYEMKNGEISETFPVANKSVLDFGSELSALNVTFSKSGPADISLTGYDRDYTWLTLESVATDSQNFGTYRILVDRSGLPRGSYPGTLIMSADNGSTVEVGFYVQVGDSIPGEAGALYAALYDSETYEGVGYWEGLQSANGYVLEFPDTPPGTYLLIIGSDMDGDLFYCDEGEFCTMYPIIGDPEVIEVSDSNVDFGHFRISTPTISVQTSQSSLKLSNDDPLRFVPKAERGLTPANPDERKNKRTLFGKQSLPANHVP